jgi:hypothetical protein
MVPLAWFRFVVLKSAHLRMCWCAVRYASETAARTKSAPHITRKQTMLVGYGGKMGALNEVTDSTEFFIFVFSGTLPAISASSDTTNASIVFLITALKTAVTVAAHRQRRNVG